MTTPRKDPKVKQKSEQKQPNPTAQFAEGAVASLGLASLDMQAKGGDQSSFVIPKLIDFIDGWADLQPAKDQWEFKDDLQSPCMHAISELRNYDRAFEIIYIKLMKDYKDINKQDKHDEIGKLLIKFDGLLKEFAAFGIQFDQAKFPELKKENTPKQDVKSSYTAMANTIPISSPASNVNASPPNPKPEVVSSAESNVKTKITTQPTAANPGQANPNFAPLKPLGRSKPR